MIHWQHDQRTKPSDAILQDLSDLSASLLCMMSRNANSIGSVSKLPGRRHLEDAIDPYRSVDQSIVLCGNARKHHHIFARVASASQRRSLSMSLLPLQGNTALERKAVTLPLQATRCDARVIQRRSMHIVQIIRRSCIPALTLEGLLCISLHI